MISVYRWLRDAADLANDRDRPNRAIAGAS